MYLFFVLHYSVCLSSLLSCLELCPVLCVTDIRVVTGERLAPRDEVNLPDSLGLLYKLLSNMCLLSVLLDFNT